MWNCPYSTDYFDEFAENFDDRGSSPSYSMLSEVASTEGITVIGGSVPELSGNKMYNTCCVFGSSGELLAKHRKIHLFDVGIPFPGDVSFKESNTFAAGEEPTVVHTGLIEFHQYLRINNFKKPECFSYLVERRIKGHTCFQYSADVGRIGIGICHDIRFPELAMVYQARGADMICYPGAFNMSTGEAVWELEQRARAVDNQLYVATCSPSRDSAGSYMIWGHSTLVNPLGEIIGTSGEEETVVIAEVDYSANQLIRESIPIGRQKREDLYHFVELHAKSSLG